MEESDMFKKIDEELGIYYEKFLQYVIDNPTVILALIGYVLCNRLGKLMVKKDVAKSHKFVWGVLTILEYVCGIACIVLFIMSVRH